MKLIVCLLLAISIHNTVHSQWVQSSGPNDGNANEMVRMEIEDKYVTNARNQVYHSSDITSKFPILPVCVNEVKFDLFKELDGNPEPGGTWEPPLKNDTNPNMFDPSKDEGRDYIYTDSKSDFKIGIRLINDPYAGENGILTICKVSAIVDLMDYLNETPDGNGTWYYESQEVDGIFDPSKDPGGTYTYIVRTKCGSDSSQVSIEIIDRTKVTPKIEIKMFSNNSNSINIDFYNKSAYKFSVDGIDFQTSNVFEQLKGNKYTVYGQETNGCGYFEEIVYILDYPRFFTPNNDQQNDVWGIKGDSNENIKTYIYDRYGNLLKILETISDTWDGNYNGNPMPTSDYWFKIASDNGIVKTGHFTLKR